MTIQQLFIVSFLFLASNCSAQKNTSTKQDNKNTSETSPILTAAERTDLYIPLLKGKNVAVFANQTSIAGNTHLVDVLQKNGVKVKVIFGPEHGFRGTADAGEKIGNAIDEATGAPVVSLYGTKRKPSWWIDCCQYILIICLHSFFT